MPASASVTVIGNSFSSMRSQTLKMNIPPRRSTRRTSAKARALSAKNMTPNWQTTASKLALSKGNSRASAWRHSTGRLVPTDAARSSMGWLEIGCDDEHAAWQRHREPACDHTRAGGNLEHIGDGQRCRALRQVDGVRLEDQRHEVLVVDVRDGARMSLLLRGADGHGYWPSGGSHNSILLPSGSTTQPNLPYSDASRFSFDLAALLRAMPRAGGADLSTR